MVDIQVDADTVALGHVAESNFHLQINFGKNLHWEGGGKQHESLIQMETDGQGAYCWHCWIAKYCGGQAPENFINELHQNIGSKILMFFIIETYFAA